MIRFCICLPLLCCAVAVAGETSPVHGFEMKRIDGTTEKLSKYEGRALLLVNVASRCGLTPQYKALQRLHERYAEKGLTVLGFPANDFGGQEPGTDAEIARFCSEKYDVTFPMYAKISVKGEGKAPLYRYLTEKGTMPGDVQWNFHKYLVDRKGRVVASFTPRTRPDDPRLLAAVEAVLTGESGGLAAAAVYRAMGKARAQDGEVLVHFGADW